jgi:hypothetical protein
VDLIDSFFSLPNGQVWPNLVASIIWATPPAIWTYLKLHRLHKDVKSTQEKVHQIHQKVQARK